MSSLQRDLTFTSGELRDLRIMLRDPISSVACLDLSMLHFFIANNGSKVSQLLPSYIILKIFSKSLIFTCSKLTKEALGQGVKYVQS